MVKCGYSIRVYAPEPERSGPLDAVSGACVDPVSDGGRDNAETPDGASDQRDIASHAAPASDPVAVASVMVNGTQATTATTGAPLPAAIPGRVSIDELRRVPFEVVMSGTDEIIPSTQEQPPRLGCRRAARSWPSTSWRRPIPRR
jgi:hypothetical protein